MSSPMTLAVTAMFLMGAADAVSRRARQLHAPVSTYLFVQCPFFMATLFVVSACSTGFGFSSTGWGLAILSGLLAFGATALLITSLEGGHASVNVVVFRLNFVLTSCVAIVVFKEDANWQKICGLVVAVGAIMVFFLGLRRGGGVARRSLGLAVMGMLVATGMQLVWAWAAKSGIERVSYLLIQSVVFMTPTAVWAWFAERMKLSRRVVKYAGINGVLLALGTLAVLASITRGEASVCFPVTQLSFVVTGLLAIAFLGESVTPSKAIGGILAVAAIVLLGV